MSSTSSGHHFVLATASAGIGTSHLSHKNSYRHQIEIEVDRVFKVVSLSKLISAATLTVLLPTWQWKWKLGNQFDYEIVPAVVLFLSMISLLSVVSDVNNMQQETMSEMQEFKVGILIWSLISIRLVFPIGITGVSKDAIKSVQYSTCRASPNPCGNPSLKTRCSS